MTRVLVSMPAKFLKDIDNVAEYENKTRSRLIRDALCVYMHSIRQARSRVKAEVNARLLSSIIKEK